MDIPQLQGSSCSHSSLFLQSQYFPNSIQSHLEIGIYKKTCLFWMFFFVFSGNLLDAVYILNCSNSFFFLHFLSVQSLYSMLCFICVLVRSISSSSVPWLVLSAVHRLPSFFLRLYKNQKDYVVPSPEE